MDYIGSKEKLNIWIFTHILKHFPSTRNKLFVDACAGSGSVSRFAASTGFKVLACDNLSFPTHLVNGSIGIFPFLKEVQYHINCMNQLSGTQGYFYNNFCERSGRLYFTTENACKIDACRQYLNNINNSKIFSILIHSLIEALSRVSNTAGTHGAFLKKFKERALDQIHLRIEKNNIGEGECKTYQADFVELVKSDEYKKINKDVIYIDPPYNERQYAPNYHLYEALVRYDLTPVAGVTGLGEWSDKKSGFCNKTTFFKHLLTIIENADCPLIFLSYSSDGLVSRDQIEDFILQQSIPLSVHSHTQKRYKSDPSRHNETSLLKEFLFELQLK